MKNLFLLFVLALFVFSCSSDDDAGPNLPDYTAFLADDTLRISSNFDDTAIDWQFLPNSNVNSSLTAYDLGDGIVRKGAGLLLGNGDQFKLWAPEYNVNSEENINSVFQAGLKQISLEDWYFFLDLNGLEYESCDANTNYELEVLQMSDIEQFGDTQVFKIWVRLSNLDFDQCDVNEQGGVLDEALMVVEFNLETID